MTYRQKNGKIKVLWSLLVCVLASVNTGPQQVLDLNTLDRKHCLQQNTEIY